MRNKLFIILGLIALVAGCASPRPGGTATLEELQQISVPPSTGHPRSDQQAYGAMSGMRSDMLKDTALSLGARSGLAWRARQVNTILASDETELDANYNFYGLMLPQNVIPPVLVDAKNILNLDSPDAIRLAQQTYRIVEQAHFVTAPPTWRDYIWMNFPQPELPDNTLLPRTPLERTVWRHYISIGWENGIKQANNIFEANLNRLNRDYNGMVLYRILFEKNMVSAPFVAKTDLGITGNGSQMNIDDQVLRITALPQLNLNGNSWKPIVVPAPLAQSQLKQKLEQQLALTPDEDSNINMTSSYTK